MKKIAHWTHKLFSPPSSNSSSPASSRSSSPFFDVSPSRPTSPSSSLNPSSQASRKHRGIFGIGASKNGSTHSLSTLPTAHHGGYNPLIPNGNSASFRSAKAQRKHLKDLKRKGQLPEAAASAPDVSSRFLNRPASSAGHYNHDEPSIHSRRWSRVSSIGSLLGFGDKTTSNRPFHQDQEGSKAPRHSNLRPAASTQTADDSPQKPAREASLPSSSARTASAPVGNVSATGVSSTTTSGSTTTPAAPARPEKMTKAPRVGSKRMANASKISSPLRSAVTTANTLISATTATADPSSQDPHPPQDGRTYDQLLHIVDGISETLEDLQQKMVMMMEIKGAIQPQKPRRRQPASVPGIVRNSSTNKDLYRCPSGRHRIPPPPCHALPKVPTIAGPHIPPQPRFAHSTLPSGHALSSITEVDSIHEESALETTSSSTVVAPGNDIAKKESQLCASLALEIHREMRSCRNSLTSLLSPIMSQFLIPPSPASVPPKASSGPIPIASVSKETKDQGQVKAVPLSKKHVSKSGPVVMSRSQGQATMLPTALVSGSLYSAPARRSSRILPPEDIEAAIKSASSSAAMSATSALTPTLSANTALSSVGSSISDADEKEVENQPGEVDMGRIHPKLSDLQPALDIKRSRAPSGMLTQPILVSAGRLLRRPTTHRSQEGGSDDGTLTPLEEGVFVLDGDHDKGQDNVDDHSNTTAIDLTIDVDGSDSMLTRAPAPAPSPMRPPRPPNSSDLSQFLALLDSRLKILEHDWPHFFQLHLSHDESLNRIEQEMKHTLESTVVIQEMKLAADAADAAASETVLASTVPDENSPAALLSCSSAPSATSTLGPSVSNDAGDTTTTALTKDNNTLNNLTKTSTAAGTQSTTQDPSAPFSAMTLQIGPELDRIQNRQMKIDQDLKDLIDRLEGHYLEQQQQRRNRNDTETTAKDNHDNDSNNDYDNHQQQLTLHQASFDGSNDGKERNHDKSVNATTGTSTNINNYKATAPGWLRMSDQETRRLMHEIEDLRRRVFQYNTNQIPEWNLKYSELHEEILRIKFGELAD